MSALQIMLVIYLFVGVVGSFLGVWAARTETADVVRLGMVVAIIVNGYLDLRNGEYLRAAIFLSFMAAGFAAFSIAHCLSKRQLRKKQPRLSDKARQLVEEQLREMKEQLRHK